MSTIIKKKLTKVQDSSRKIQFPGVFGLSVFTAEWFLQIPQSPSCVFWVRLLNYQPHSGQQLVKSEVKPDYMVGKPQFILEVFKKTTDMGRSM